MAVMGFGVWEAVSGWLQLLGFQQSRHALYPATGSFYNPGPFCAFLAVTVPVALWCALRPRHLILHWAGIISLILSLSLMPVLMGRTGWIAAVAGALTVLWADRLIRRPSPPVAVGGVLLLLVAAALLVWLKPASALGRLFLWRIGLSAAASAPLTGVGWDYTAGALGSAQEAFFASHPGSIFTSVASSPSYAFNEFLQIAIAFGWPAMLLFIALLAVAVAAALRGRCSGVAGSIVAFAVVCLASYPLQFPGFIILLSLLMLAAVVALPAMRPLPRAILSGLIIIAAVFPARALIARNQAARSWTAMRYLCRPPLSAAALGRLDSLSAVYACSPEFLFDYGKALRGIRLYHKSDSILHRGLLVSADPMFLNLIGRNFHDRAMPDSAGFYFMRAASRLPDRMYPYYLTALLHADPAHTDTLRCLSACDRALTMRPRITSPAIRQMRARLTAIRDSLTNP